MNSRGHLQLQLDCVREDIVRWWFDEKHSVAFVKEQLNIIHQINATIGQVQFALHRWGVTRPRNTRSSKLLAAAVSRVYSKRNCECCGNEYQPSGSIQIYCEVCAPDKSWWRRIKRFGINKQKFNEMMQIQNGKCGICDDTLDNTAHVDHDHSTNLVRGLLCGRCNLRLNVVEDITFVFRAKVYLENYEQNS